MGAFFLSHNDSVISDKGVKELYAKKGFGELHHVQIGDYQLRLYRKQLAGVENYWEEGDSGIYVTGSLFYRSSGYRDSLKYLFEDFMKGEPDPNQLYGNYAILFYNSTSRTISFCMDPSFIKNVYFDDSKRIIATDFLGIVEASPDHYNINTAAIAESMTTGNLISPDTYAVEIQKVDCINIEDIGIAFPGIKVMILKPSVPSHIAGRDQSLMNANRLLSEYFESAGNICNEYGATIGLTGGFDSRLLLIHARKKIKRLVTNSFWRPGKDYYYARLLAGEAGLDFISFEKEPFQVPPADLMIEQAFYFFDGQVRSQNYWDEEFNLPDYCSRISSGHLVGFHGSGGEQYRNADRIAGRISLKSYILYEWMFRQCGDMFISRELRDKVYSNIMKKIGRLTGITGRRIGLEEIKIIQNEVWNGANRSMRLNTLNQQQFYFAPFTEFHISRAAYLYTPYLGDSLEFQAELLKIGDPELASVKNNYGFDFSRGLPFSEKIIPPLINLVPRSLFYKIYFLIRRMQSNNYRYDLEYSRSAPVMQELSKSIDFERLSKNKNLGNSLLSYGFLLRNLKVNPAEIKQTRVNG